MHLLYAHDKQRQRQNPRVRANFQNWVGLLALQICPWSKEKNGSVYPPNTLVHLCSGIMHQIRWAGRPEIDIFKACKMVLNYVFVFHAQQVNCYLDRSQVVDVEYSSPHCASCSKYRSSLRAIYTQRSSDNDPSNWHVKSYKEQISEFSQEKNLKN